MANWKKVLVSGSQIQVAGITASNIPSSGGADDRVVVFNAADGAFSSVTQGSIQGITVANFGITGSDGSGDMFNATADTIKLGGDIVSTVAGSTGVTSIQLNLPGGILSGSAQIASDISGAFDSASNALVSQSNSTNLLATANLSSSESNILNIVTLLSESNAIEQFAITIESSSDANTGNLTTVLSQSNSTNVLATANLSSSESNILNIVHLLSESNSTNVLATANLGDITTNTTNIATLSGATGSYITNIAGTANEITVSSGSGDNAQVTIALPDDVTIGNDLTVSNNLTVLGIETIEGQASVVSGAVQFGSGSTIPDINSLGGHQFTGSVNISGGLNVNGVATITDLTDNNSIGVSNIVIHDANGQLFSAGDDIASDISGAFDSASNALVTNVASNLSASNSSNLNIIHLLSQSNSTNVLATANLSSSESNILNIVTLLSESNAVEQFAITIESSSDSNTINVAHNLSQSDANTANINAGIFFDTSTSTGFAAPLASTASFAATNGFSAGGFSVNATGGTVTYAIAGNFFSGSGFVSNSAQIEIGAVAGSPATHSFTRLSVSGQDDVLADSNADTLTLIGGTNITIVTTASTDTIQINATDEDVTVTNLETRLGEIDTSVTIGNDAAVNTTISGDLNVNENLTVTKDLIVLGDTVQTNVANVFVEDQFILLNSGALGTGNDNDKDGGLVVDTGGGIGTALLYDFDKKAWGFKGADGTAGDLVSGSQISNAGNPITPNLFVATVSQSNLNPFTSTGGAISAGSASLTPKFGTATAGDTAGTNLGSMHVNSTSGEIWIYS